MPVRTDVIFLYDGSFDGLLCCIFKCYEEKLMPSYIRTADAEQLMFGETLEIITETDKARRVENGIKQKIGRESLYHLKKSFLSCDEDKDILILKFVILGFRYGRQVRNMLAEDTVDRLRKIGLHVADEAHLLLGFVRFSEHGGVLISVIEPKNCVLPIIADHFCDRFRNEKFIIYDKNHHLALFHATNHSEIIPIENFELAAPDQSEVRFRKLWKTFFDTVAIKERYNPVCQRTHLPLRYRGNMTEFINGRTIASDENSQAKINSSNDTHRSSDAIPDTIKESISHF